MSVAFWSILVISILAGAIILEAYLKRNKRSKPLHEKFNATENPKTPLGMEATDIEGFEQANQLNDNLARYNGVQMIRDAKSWSPASVKNVPQRIMRKFSFPKIRDRIYGGFSNSHETGGH